MDVKFWTVRFLKTEPEPNFDFPHIPSDHAVKLAGKAVVFGRVTML